jgi:hypothetical protein
MSMIQCERIAVKSMNSVEFIEISFLSFDFFCPTPTIDGTKEDQVPLIISTNKTHLVSYCFWKTRNRIEQKSKSNERMFRKFHDYLKNERKQV